MVLDVHTVRLKLTASRQRNGELLPLARAAIVGAIVAGASQSAVTLMLLEFITGQHKQITSNDANHSNYVH